MSVIKELEKEFVESQTVGREKEFRNHFQKAVYFGNYNKFKEMDNRYGPLLMEYHAFTFGGDVAVYLSEEEFKKAEAEIPAVEPKSTAPAILVKSIIATLGKLKKENEHAKKLIGLYVRSGEEDSPPMLTYKEVESFIKRAEFCEEKDVVGLLEDFNKFVPNHCMDIFKDVERVIKKLIVIACNKNFNPGVFIKATSLMTVREVENS